MLFNPVFLSSLLLASTVLAVPPSRYSTRAARRREGRQSQLNGRLEQSSVAHSDVTVTSTNWAGALWDQDDGTFTSVTGTFTVPTPSGKNGVAASAWVGIDGDTCQSAILQTGVDFTVSNSQVSYDAWYEWFPDYSYYFSDINISAGDVIKLNVTAFSTTQGIAIIENLTNGQNVSMKLGSTYALCQQNAEWIVEDFEDGNYNLVPFANFGTVTFRDAVATGTGTYTPDGAIITNINQNDNTLTSVSIDKSSVTISYV